MLSVFGIFTEYAFNFTMACPSDQLIMTLFVKPTWYYFHLTENLTHCSETDALPVKRQIESRKQLTRIILKMVDPRSKKASHQMPTRRCGAMG